MPVIPSKSDTTNRNIGHFNDLVVHELVQDFSKLFIVWGTGQFANINTGQLADRYHKSPDPCGLHLNKYGISRLVSMIKQSVFQARSIGGSGKVHNSRLYSNTLRTGPRVSVHR